MESVNNPMLTPVLGEVFSSLVPLRYKGSESVSRMAPFIATADVLLYRFTKNKMSRISIKNEKIHKKIAE